MKTVLYIDGSPLYVTNIKRNASGKIIHGHVVNGNWELRLNSTEVYAFEDRTSYGWGDELYQRSCTEYTTYEEVEVDISASRVPSSDYRNDYQEVINAANLIREQREQNLSN